MSSQSCFAVTFSGAKWAQWPGTATVFSATSQQAGEIFAIGPWCYAFAQAFASGRGRDRLAHGDEKCFIVERLSEEGTCPTGQGSFAVSWVVLACHHDDVRSWVKRAQLREDFETGHARHTNIDYRQLDGVTARVSQEARGIREFLRVQAIRCEEPSDRFKYGRLVVEQADDICSRRHVVRMKVAGS
jgi:hypothetical protein